MPRSSPSHTSCRGASPRAVTRRNIPKFPKGKQARVMLNSLRSCTLRRPATTSTRHLARPCPSNSKHAAARMPGLLSGLCSAENKGTGCRGVERLEDWTGQLLWCACKTAADHVLSASRSEWPLATEFAHANMAVLYCKILEISLTSTTCRRWRNGHAFCAIIWHSHWQLRVSPLH